MANSYFSFKQFTIQQDQSAMKVTTDGCLFGAWAAQEIRLLNHPDSRCLDIGAGTGLLSLMIAQQNPVCNIDAVEIDKETAAQATQNIKAAGREDRVQLIQQDIRQFQPDRKYDIIFSNPPFYENELKGENSKKNQAHHHEGLILADLLQCCKSLLNENGRIYLLLPYKREREVLAKAEAAGYSVVQHRRVRPAEQLDYFRILLELQVKHSEPVAVRTGDIAVKDHQDQYTHAFTELLKEYYLYL